MAWPHTFSAFPPNGSETLKFFLVGPLPLQDDETQIHVDKIKLLFTDTGMFPLILDFII
jgi:hypothetical protein